MLHFDFIIVFGVADSTPTVLEVVLTTHRGLLDTLFICPRDLIRSNNSFLASATSFQCLNITKHKENMLHFDFIIVFGVADSTPTVLEVVSTTSQGLLDTIYICPREFIRSNKIFWASATLF